MTRRWPCSKWSAMSISIPLLYLKRRPTTSFQRESADWISPRSLNYRAESLRSSDTSRTRSCGCVEEEYRAGSQGRKSGQWALFESSNCKRWWGCVEWVQIRFSPLYFMLSHLYGPFTELRFTEHTELGSNDTIKKNPTPCSSSGSSRNPGACQAWVETLLS